MSRSGKGCVHGPAVDDTLCDDAKPCTGGDACLGGSCVGGPWLCQCEKDADCVAFEDGNVCSGTLYCNKADGLCALNPATVVQCAATGGGPCAAPACDPISGKCALSPKNEGTACDDSVPCTKGDVCAAGKRTGSADTCPCHSDAQCKSQDDGNLCNGTLYCDKSKTLFACVLKPGSVVTCPDLGQAPCSVHQCEPKSGACKRAPCLKKGDCAGALTCDAAIASCVACSHASHCAVNEACQGGLCIPGTACRWAATQTLTPPEPLCPPSATYSCADQQRDGFRLHPRCANCAGKRNQRYTVAMNRRGKARPFNLPPCCKRGASLRSLAVIGVILATACGNATDEPSKATPPVAATAGAPCPSIALQPDGSCCPVGHMWDATDKGCAAVGPPECATTVLTDPQACEPRYCRADVDAAGQPCSGGWPNCLPVARLCTATEIAGGAGCRAGWWQNSPQQPCRLAGGDVAGPDPEWTTPPPPLSALSPVFPSVVPLPPVNDTWFCGDGEGTDARLCRPADKPCTAGTGDAADCRLAGVPWHCPPGFVVQAKATAANSLPTCTPDPALCSEDPWVNIAQAAGTLFVAASATGAGDGSKAKPYDTLHKALNAAPTGGTLVVAAGTYSFSQLLVLKSITIAGSCAAAVQFVGSNSEASIKVSGAKAALVLDNVTLSGAGPAVLVIGGASAKLAHTYLLNNGEIGAVSFGAGASLAVVSSMVEATVPAPKIGAGIAALGGGKVTLTDVRLSHNHMAGLWIAEWGSTMVAQRVVVDGTAPAGLKASYGCGVIAEHGADASFDSIDLVGNSRAGVLARGIGTRLKLRRALVRGTQPLSGDPNSGYGVAVEGCVADLQAVRVTKNYRTGVAVGGIGSELNGSGVLVDNTELDSTAQGLGAIFAAGAKVQLDEARFSANYDSGVWIADPTTQVQLRRSVADANRANSPTASLVGCGINARFGSQVDLHYVRVSDNDDCGIGLDGASTRLTGSNLVVDGTRTRGSQIHGSGRAIAVLNGTAQFDGVRLSANAGLGVSVANGGQVRIAALVVDGLVPIGVDQPAVGLVAHHEAKAWVSGAQLHAAQGLGVLVDFGSQVHLADAVVADWQAFVGQGGGALVAQRASSVTLVGARLIGNDSAQLIVHDVGSIATVSGVLAVGDRLTEPALGGGLLASLGAKLEVTSCRIVRTTGVGVGALNAALVARQTVVAGVQPRYLIKKAGQPRSELVAVADAFLINSGSGSTVDRVVASGYQRAGLALVSPPGGHARQSLFTGGFYGVVQPFGGNEAFTLRHNAVFGNNQNQALGAQLAVPEPPKTVEFEF